MVPWLGGANRGLVAPKSAKLVGVNSHPVGGASVVVVCEQGCSAQVRAVGWQPNGDMQMWVQVGEGLGMLVSRIRTVSEGVSSWSLEVQSGGARWFWAETGWDMA